MEEVKYIQVIDILTDKIKSLELDNALKGYEIDRLKKQLDTTLAQIEAETTVAPEKEVRAL